MTITAPPTSSFTSEAEPFQGLRLIRNAELRVGNQQLNYNEVFAEVREFFAETRNSKLTIIIGGPDTPQVGERRLTYFRFPAYQGKEYGFVSCACNEALLGLFPK